MINRKKLVPVTVGVDEAGRGAWAGPIFGAAAYVPEDFKERVRDSKKMSRDQRENLYSKILKKCSVAMHAIYSKPIDDHGIQWANAEVLRSSAITLDKHLNSIGMKIGKLIVDGSYEMIQKHVLDGPAVDFPWDNIEIRYEVGADDKYPSVSVASVVAKVMRDRRMAGFASTYPEYGFHRHMGYGTTEHREAINKYGFCPIHRKSYHIKGLEENTNESDS